MDKELNKILNILKFTLTIQQIEKIKEVLLNVYNQGVIDGKTEKDF